MDRSHSSNSRSRSAEQRASVAHSLSPDSASNMPLIVPDAPQFIDVTSPEIRYTFDGHGQIGWSARYTAQPLRHNSSDAVPVVGTCVLQVDFTAYPTDVDGNPPADRSRLTAPGLDDVVEVVTFPPTVNDAVTQCFIGLRSDSPNLRLESVRDETFVISVRRGK
ncbi:AMIN-like domain-containing (lipo)protein [Rhodococcoides corynebacterioides]|uniref:AMIN-like domain-containing (lipo)protein n=1 Tax=Rhodococcoides corynebacterioides TaxID=53972 RepID=UPI003FA687E6